MLRGSKKKQYPKEKSFGKEEKKNAAACTLQRGPRCNDKINGIMLYEFIVLLVKGTLSSLIEGGNSLKNRNALKIPKRKHERRHSRNPNDKTSGPGDRFETLPWFDPAGGSQSRGTPCGPEGSRGAEGAQAGARAKGGREVPTEKKKGGSPFAFG